MSATLTCPLMATWNSVLTKLVGELRSTKLICKLTITFIGNGNCRVARMDPPLIHNAAAVIL